MSQAALNRDIFSGSPQLSTLDKYSADLTPDKQAFMDNKAQQFLKVDQRKKQLTAHGHSQIMTKTNSRSGAAGIVVGVPNQRTTTLPYYGKEEQKHYFLPVLVTGEHWPSLDSIHGITS
ncbi:unnamed protein product [Aphanomyces euteiches]